MLTVELPPARSRARLVKSEPPGNVGPLMTSPDQVLFEPPVCCGQKTVSVNCFDHREWMCIRCVTRHGFAPFYEPQWERDEAPVAMETTMQELQQPRGSMVKCEGCGFHVERENVVEYPPTLAAAPQATCLRCATCEAYPLLRESYRRGYNAGLDAAADALTSAVTHTNLRRGRP